MPQMKNAPEAARAPMRAEGEEVAGDDKPGPCGRPPVASNRRPGTGTQIRPTQRTQKSGPRLVGPRPAHLHLAHRREEATARK